MFEDENIDELIEAIGSEQYYELYRDLYHLCCFGCLIYRANRIMCNRLNRKLRETGIKLNIEQFRVLLYLWEEDGMLQSKLAEQTLKDKASLARTLDTMEKQKFISRTDAKRDKRRKRVYLTEEGKRLRERLIPVALRDNLEYIAMIGDDKIDTGRDILMELIEKMTGEALSSEKC